MTDSRVLVVGIGDDGPDGLGSALLDRIQSASFVYGGERHLELFSEVHQHGRVIRSPLNDVVTQIRADMEVGKVVVFASGDPLYYGIGSLLLKQLGVDAVTVIPHVSSIQLAFARAGEGWSRAKVISLHGKPIQGLAQTIHGHPLVALLTDDVNTPSMIAGYLKRFGMYEYDAFVAEDLGGEHERVGWYTLDELVTRTFSSLNVVILKHSIGAVVPTFLLGMSDASFSQRKPDRGLITKREVRVLSLSELALKPGGVLWDIGTCTGSISIEATLSTPGLQVYAVEKNEADFENLRQNQVKFRTDFVAVHARAPEGLDQFPDPDSVFIGGSGGELVELLQLCASRLKEDGRIVVNAATIENLYQAQQTLKELGFSVSITLVQTARSKPILQLTRFEGMNPVYLVTATRVSEEGE